MKITLNWKNAILYVWVAVSVVYVSYDMWTGFKIGVMQNAYNAGRTDTVKALLDQAENKECKPFNVYMENRKADLINIACFQQTGTGATK